MKTLLVVPLLILAAAVAALPTAADVSPRIVRSIRANLDGDAYLERVQVLDSLRANPYGGTKPLHEQYVRVLDVSDGRPFEQQVSPLVEYVRISIATVVGATTCTGPTVTA